MMRDLHDAGAVGDPIEEQRTTNQGDSMTPTDAAIRVIDDVVAQHQADVLFEVSSGNQTFSRNEGDYHCSALGLVNAILDELDSTRVAIEHSAGGMPMRACRWVAVPLEASQE